jgi:hypothetical protein
MVLVTANSADFGTQALHVDLTKDLDVLGLSHGHVRLFHTLEELNHGLIIPTLERLDALRSQLAGGTGPMSLPDWVKDNLRDLLWDEEGLGPLEPGHGSSRFSSIVDVRRVQIDAVRQLGADQVLVAATAKIAGSLSVSADWEDYQKYEDVREFFGTDDDEPFSSVSADFPISATAAFSLVLSGERDVLSWELDWYEAEYGSRSDINPHPIDEETEHSHDDA